MQGLIELIISLGYLHSENIIEAFKKIKRDDFISGLEKEYAKENRPLSIGYGQTISQPMTVAFMLEKLQPRPNDHILDIGSGSGWQTALLCELVGEKGKVYAIEIISELKKFGQHNVQKYKYSNAKFYCRDGASGLKNKAPFDRIIAAASAEQIPMPWLEQLKIGGRLVCPIKESIWQIDKISENQFDKKEFTGFVFVPLVNKK